MMNTVQRRILQCKLLLQMERNPEYAKQLGLVDKSQFETNQINNTKKQGG